MSEEEKKLKGLYKDELVDLAIELKAEIEKLKEEIKLLKS